MPHASHARHERGDYDPRMEMLRSFALAAIVLGALRVAAAPDDEALVLEVAAEDIAAVVWELPSVSIQLTRPAATELAKITRNNVGRMLELRVDGIRAVRASIIVEIDSGSVYVAAPSKQLRERLTEVQRALEHR